MTCSISQHKVLFHSGDTIKGDTIKYNKAKSFLFRILYEIRYKRNDTTP